MTLRVTRADIAALLEEIQALYLEDATPWIIGYSGGKDSSATLQLIWVALQLVPVERRTKSVHVISTDTLVENPAIVAWQNRQHAAIRKVASAQGLPIVATQLKPDLENSFWVNLIGRGYPAPRQGFRWCTERLKIKPSTAYIETQIKTSGEVILCLGTRKAESAARARVMAEAERGRVRDRLSPAKAQKNALVYSPIEDWTDDDVWAYLLNNPCPWDELANKHLMALYASASADNECPIVVDTSTPSCGGSRFGCYVCTLVDKDRSLSAMIENDPRMEFMLPLRDLRDRLDIANDRHLRDYRRMTGLVQIMDNGRNIPGPYHQAARIAWLRDVLQTEREVRRLAPPEFTDIRLISDDELGRIQDIWVREKYELEDVLPDIVHEFRDVERERLQLVPSRMLDELRASCADEHVYQFCRDIWGARLLDGDVDGVGLRYEFRTADEAVGVLSHQPLLFAPTSRSLEAIVIKQAAAAAASCPVNDAPWVALGKLDRLAGKPERSQQTPYLSAYYGEIP